MNSKIIEQTTLPITVKKPTLPIVLPPTVKKPIPILKATKSPKKPKKSYPRKPKKQTKAQPSYLQRKPKKQKPEKHIHIEMFGEFHYTLELLFYTVAVTCGLVLVVCCICVCYCSVNKGVEDGQEEETKVDISQSVDNYLSVELPIIEQSRVLAETGWIEQPESGCDEQKQNSLKKTRRLKKSKVIIKAPKIVKKSVKEPAAKID